MSDISIIRNNKLSIKIIIYISLFSIVSNVSFIYPNSVTLKNKNIFVIHRYGISICNSFCSKIIKEILTFLPDEEISTEEKLSKVTISQFDDGSIISVIIDKIYFFDINGEFEFKSQNSITSFQNKYFTLSPHKIENNYYYYLLGYAYSNTMYIYYYKYCSNANEPSCIEKNHLVALREGLRPRNGFLTNNGLSFQYTSYENLILCMYYLVVGVTNYLTVEYLYVTNSGSIDFKYDNVNFVFEDNYKDITCLKSAIYPNGLKAIFCMYNIYGITKCLFYEMKNLYYDAYVYDKKCLTQFYGMNIKYFPEKDQFVFSCLIQGGGIHYEIMNNNFGYPYPYGYPIDKFEEYSMSIKGHSILYYASKDCYYVLFDLKYNEIEYTFKPLKNIAEDIPETEEIYENQIEEKNKYTNIEINENSSEFQNEDKMKTTKIENNLENDVKTEIQNEVEMKSTNIEINKENEENTENKNNENEEKTENEIKINNCKVLEKCGLCNEESIKLNLCLSCNIQKGYFPLNSTPNKQLSNDNGFIECINLEKKPSDYYFDKIRQDFSPCYETCATCDYGGNSEEHNCTSCGFDLIFKPDIDGTTNCIISCSYSYFYTNIGQYKCTDSSQCPDGHNFYIEEKRKCIDKCEKDNLFKYQYNGECLKKCPLNTNSNIGEYLCKDANTLNCLLTELKYMKLKENITDSEIELMAKNYALEFKYTDKHLSVYENKIYTILFYKKSDCVSELIAQIPEIEIEKCIEKMKNENQVVDQELVIVIILKNIDGKLSFNSLFMFNPNTGEKLSYKDICMDDILKLKEYIFDKWNVSKDDIDQFKSLIEQNVDIFNLSSPFYTDICYDFISPIKGKDIPLKDRIALFFPNITLCEDGCNFIGVNKTSFKSICECKFKNFIEHNNILSNPIYQNRLNELNHFFEETNIEVLKCYKYFLSYKYYALSQGAYIIFALFIFQIITTVFFHFKNVFSIRKYVFCISSKYISYLVKQKNNNINEIISFNENKNLNDKGIQKKSEKKIKIPKRKSNIITNKSTINPHNSNPTKKCKSKSINFIKNNSIKDNSSKSNIIIINNNLKNDLSDNLKKNSKLNSIRNSKINEEILISSNENMKMFKKSSPSIQSSNIISSELNLNIKDNYNINIEEYISTEIDSMDYYDTIRKDNRNFFQYFYHKLKENQMILAIIYGQNQLIPRTTKILLLILDIDLYFFVNGLFFTENYISVLLHISI